MIEKYKNFLKNKGVSPRTQKNYLADVRYFLKWIERSRISAESTDKSGESGEWGLSWFNQSIITAFKNALVVSQTPPATINRRLSGLRQFGEFLINQSWLRENPAKKISGISEILGISADLANKSGRLEKKGEKWQTIFREFKRALESQGQSKTTIKNYTSDVRQFLDWANTQT